MNSLKTRWFVERVPWGFVVACAFICAIELNLGARLRELSDDSAAFVQFAYQACRHSGPIKILCFGDSQVKCGIVPRVLETMLSEPAYNLAIGGATAPSTYLAFSQALESGARPSAVVVNFAPHLLNVSPRRNATLLSDQASLRECVDLGLTAHDSDFFASLALQSLFPSMRLRHSLQKRVLRALRGESIPTPTTGDTGWRNWSANQGTHLLPDRLDVSEKAFWDERSSVNPRSAMNLVSGRYVAKFLNLASSRHIPVFVVVPPFHPRIQVKREAAGLDEVYTKFLKKLQRTHPTITVIDARHSGFDASMFSDASHLSRRGALAFTASLSDAIASCRTGEVYRPAWVTVSTPGRAPENIAVEDVAESIRVLDSASQTVRK